MRHLMDKNGNISVSLVIWMSSYMLEYRKMTSRGDPASYIDPLPYRIRCRDALHAGSPK